jgi:hypothetical protein
MSVTIGEMVDVEQATDQQQAASEPGRIVASRDQLKQVQQDAEWFDEAALTNRTLEEEERIRGEKTEMERHRERAKEVHEAGRTRERAEDSRKATSGMALHTNGFSKEQVWESASMKPSFKRADVAGDPREYIGQETLADINQTAARIVAERPFTATRAEVSRWITSAVLAGDEACVMEAALKVVEWLESRDGQELELAKVTPEREQQYVTVEGEVSVLFAPANRAQSQVGRVQNEAGDATVKFNIWERSQVDVEVNVGEQVRFENAVLGWYDGDVVLQVTGETSVSLIEEAADVQRQPSASSYTPQNQAGIEAVSPPGV